MSDCEELVGVTHRRCLGLFSEGDSAEKGRLSTIADILSNLSIDFLLDHWHFPIIK